MTRRIELTLAALVFLAHGYFYNGTGWNQNARLDTVYSLVEGDGQGQRSFRIDRFVTNTGDWARYGDHYYSNKAPGTPILGALIYFPLLHVERWLGASPGEFTTALWNAYAINLWVSVFWTALAVVFLFRTVLRRTPAHVGHAVFVCLVYGLGTLVFPYNSQLWGHTTAAALLIIGHHCLTGSARRSAVIAGLAFGAAVGVDYLTAVSALLAVAYVVARREWMRLLGFAVGGALPVGALLLFHRLNLGGWLTTAASLTNPGLGGADHFGWPSPAVLLAFLVSPRLGLLIFSPVLLFALPRLVRALWRRDDAEAVLCAVNVVAYLLLVSGYEAWHGGRATGPRYLIPSLPFWCLLLPDAMASPRQRVVALALGALSALHMLAVAAVDPMLKWWVSNPLYGVVIPSLLRGEFKVAEYAFHTFEFADLTDEQRRRSVFNLGQALFGLQGLSSLLPMMALAALMLAYVASRARLVDAAAQAAREKRGGRKPRRR